MITLKHKNGLRLLTSKITLLVVVSMIIGFFGAFTVWGATALAAPVNEPSIHTSVKLRTSSPLSYFAATYTCGGGTGNTAVTTSIDLGCTGQGNPVIDMLFGIIRFLSDGVGLVVVGSLIYAGIQYSSSRGDPNATAMAQKRIRAAVIALFIYIFAYAILNYIIPTGFFK